MEKQSVTEKLDVKVKSLAAEANATIGLFGKSTVAIVDVNGTTGIGLAVCMEGDKYSEEVGIGIATGRALRMAATTIEETWVARSTTKKEWKNKHRK